MTNNNYKIVCPTLNVVLLIKKYNLKQERVLWEKLRTKIQTAKEPIQIDGYMEAILKCFLEDSDKFFESVTDDDSYSNIIKAAYTSVVSLYPIFQLEFICNELNANLFTEQIRGLFAEKFAEVREDMEDPNIGFIVLDKEKIERLDKYFRKNLVGQDLAITKLINSLKVIAAGLSEFSSFFFVGPTGVGKTQLARLLGKQLGGNFFKINCGEFSSGHEYAKLIGSPPGYVGHTEKSILAEKADESSRWVFLFDEIEKAHHKFYDFLLSLLDDGTVTDNMGRTLDFTDSIFIFTSNQGMHDLKLGKSLGFDNTEKTYNDAKEDVKESIKKHFPPEFINRVDEFVYFNQLTEKEIRKIVSLELKGIPIKKTKSLLDYVVKGGYSLEYGARNVKRFIKSNVSVVVADAILEKRIPKKEGSMYSPKITNGTLTIVDTINYEESIDASEQCDSPQTSGAGSS
jgi:ATP-dependent Clp protease ATP-binding subunit ClpA